MDRPDRQEYIRKVLECYRCAPGTTGYTRQSDRQLANHLYDRMVSASVVEAAIILATARRVLRPPDYPPLAPIRSLHYFLPVIEEITAAPLAPDYLDYLRGKIEKHLNSPQR